MQCDLVLVSQPQFSTYVKSYVWAGWRFAFASKPNGLHFSWSTILARTPLKPAGILLALAGRSSQAHSIRILMAKRFSILTPIPCGGQVATSISLFWDDDADRFSQSNCWYHKCAICELGQHHVMGTSSIVSNLIKVKMLHVAVPCRSAVKH